MKIKREKIRTTTNHGWQSKGWIAWIESDYDDNTSNLVDVTVQRYGATEAEAIANLQESFNALISGVCE